MILTRLDLHNWMRYRGRHVLELEPKVYGIVARREGDPDQSNWQGKTSLAEAIRFVLYGEHRFRREDGWITNGEDEGHVYAHFDNDFFAARSKRRGKGTKLECGSLSSMRGPHTMKEGPAQDEIVRRSGLTLRDFEATAYFGQRETARLVLADPAKRMEVVESWLQLAPLLRAEEANEGRLEALEKKAETAHQQVMVLQARRDAELDAMRIPAEDRARATIPFVEILRDRLAREVEERTLIDQKLREAKAEQAKLLEVDRVRVRVTAFRDLEGQLAGLARPDGDHVQERVRAALQAAEAWTALSKQHALARKRVDELRPAARGEFDGRCPVAGIACPAKDQINAATAPNRRRYEEAAREAKVAYDAEQEARRVLDEAVDARTEVLREVDDYDRVDQRVRADRAEVEGLRAPVVDQAVIDSVPQWEQAAQESAAAQAIYRRAIASQEQVEQGLASLQAVLDELEPRIVTLQAAAHILGRQGARRRIAQPFLEQLEQGANEALAECGADLRLRVLWDHEGKDLARACAACGYRFPESARVKECGRCGAGRGKNVVNRLEFEFSDRSVAAEDLAGVVVQLAAAAWLRHVRGTAFATAILDEPMAHCDRANRRAMTRSLTQMLCSRFGFEQALVITHTPDAASFPGTILVTGSGPHSKVEVL